MSEAAAVGKGGEERRERERDERGKAEGRTGAARRGRRGSPRNRLRALFCKIGSELEFSLLRVEIFRTAGGFQVKNKRAYYSLGHFLDRGLNSVNRKGFSAKLDAPSEFSLLRVNYSELKGFSGKKQPRRL